METPPRTWGRRGGPDFEDAGLGNTPTHVGKTYDDDTEKLMGKKHPHARGEDYIWGQCAIDEKETPPRTWGRPAEP